MYVVRRVDGSLTKDYTEILEEQSNFYQKLYTSDPLVEFKLKNTTGITLNESQKIKLDKEIQEGEIFDAIMTLKPNKTPGCDRLSLAFYRKFYLILKQPLLNLYRKAIQCGCLNATAHRGLINLIPKKARDDLVLKNWRPIVLLCYDYKILSKIIANHMDLVTSDLIGSQQVGFMKNRSIHFNIKKTMEIVSYLNKKGSPGVIAIIDFEKCFDRIEHVAIRGALKYFNFGEEFINMVFLLFTNIELCTQNNGCLSKTFYKQCGINQGCNGSPGIYLYTSEVMAHILKEKLQGLSIHGIRNVLSQFADDTSIFLTFEHLEINTFCQTMRHVEANTGLKISYEKTSLYRVGSLVGSNAQMYTSKQLNWTDVNISTLGIEISTDGTIVSHNFDVIIEKMRSVMDNWYNRSLSLMGKIMIINTLMGSLFVYKMIALLNMSQNQVKTMNKLILEFLWKGKNAKISRYLLSRSKIDGGL